MSKVYILLAIHNRKELTLECLACLHNQTYSNYQIVVVDDGSTDGSKEAILTAYPQTKIILGDGSLWWTASMNKGLEYILSVAHDNDLVLTLNDDTEFDKNYLETLVKYAEKYPQVCIGSLLKNYYQKDLIEDSGVKINWDGYFYYQIPFSESNQLVEPDTLSCRGTIIPIKIFKTIGLFNQKHLPHYISDYEFFIRAKRAGFRLLMCYKTITYNKDRRLISLSKKKLWWRMFNKKSSSNIFNSYYIIIKHSPRIFLKFKNVFLYTLRSFRKLS